MSQDITAIDLFCGAGGSSTGLVNAGVRVQTAVNHWKLAIDTHATNHPDTDHDCADIRQTHPAIYPRTNIFWASPECTNHSLAKGRKRKNIDQLDLWGNSQVDPTEERSRATMREVVEFAEYHRHEIIIVENVVDIRYWQHYDAWTTEMTNLGYKHKALYLNAQFFSVPQSRDRIYIVFWRKGNKAPDLDFRPPAICEKHGQVEAVQSWKKPESQWGRFGSRRQYVYRCPQCAAEVMPFYVPAAVAIDWSLPSQRIGDREKPLKPKTIERILAGLKKFSRQAELIDLGYEGGDRNYDVDAPMPTQTTRQTLALLQPFIAEMRQHSNGRALSEALATIVSSARHHALVTPPFLTSQHQNPDGTANRVRGIDEPMPVITTFNNEHQLVVPPYLLSMNHSDERSDSTEQPMPTVMPQTVRALVIPPIVAAYYGNDWTYAAASEPMPTQTTVQRHALITPEEMLPDCGFRMLSPAELQRGMSFEDSYIILGNKREQVRQIGNAVCPNVAEAIVKRCVESLA